MILTKRVLESLTSWMVSDSKYNVVGAFGEYIFEIFLKKWKHFPNNAFRKSQLYCNSKKNYRTHLKFSLNTYIDNS